MRSTNYIAENNPVSILALFRYAKRSVSTDRINLVLSVCNRDRKLDAIAIAYQ
ncbi:MAG: hypothetical protein MUD14_02385 [Hydrococcus sp. Prado102]|nr:hypothetical protein [Hydrococcus sp. Prado102]